jgi:membrane associated rhomboid family serine protease
VAYWAHIGGFIAGLVITFLARPFLDRSAAATTRFSTPYRS